MHSLSRIPARRAPASQPLRRTAAAPRRGLRVRHCLRLCVLGAVLVALFPAGALSAQEAAPPATVSVVVPLRHLNATAAAAALRKFQDADAGAVTVEAQNDRPVHVIVLRGPQAAVTRLQAFLRALDVPPRSEVPVQALSAVVAATAKALGVQFLFEPGLLEHKTVAQAAQRSAPASPAQHWRRLQSLLAVHRIGWLRIQQDAPVYQLLQFAELGRQVHPLVENPAELPEDAAWGTLFVPLATLEPRRAQRLLLSQITRPGGTVLPAEGANPGVIVIDSRGQLARVAALLAALDKKPVRETRTIDTSPMDPRRVEEHLQALYANEMGHQLFLSPTQSPAKKALFVRVDAELAADVFAAVASILKTAKPTAPNDKRDGR